jgi:hypothetical protein
MPTPPEQILTAVMNKIAALSGIQAVSEVEDRDVPPQVTQGPVVVAYWRAGPQTTAETGLGADITEEWELRIYVPLSDLPEAQRDLYQAREAVLSVGRSESLITTLTNLGGVYAGTLSITDPGDEPIVEFDDRWMMKQLILRVQRYAAGVA